MKKLLILFSLFVSSAVFGMQQLAMKPMTQVAAAAAVPVIKQAVRNYSDNVSACSAKGDGRIVDYSAQEDEKFVHQFIKDNYRQLATTAPVSDALRRAHYKVLQDSCVCNNTKVCRINGDTVGYVTYLAKKSWFGNIRKGLIAQLGVDQSVRGNGIGKKLMLAAEQDLMNQHPSLTKIELMITNFYESIGYRPAGHIDGVCTITFRMAKQVRDIPISARVRSTIQRILKV